MAVTSVLLNSGISLVAVAFNRGPFVTMNGIAPPAFGPQAGYPAPPWDNGGASRGALGPGSNVVQLRTSGFVLPTVTLDVPNLSPGAIQTYLMWFLDKETLAAFLCATVLSAGAEIACGCANGVAAPFSSP